MPKAVIIAGVKNHWSNAQKAELFGMPKELSSFEQTSGILKLVSHYYSGSYTSNHHLKEQSSFNIL